MNVLSNTTNHITMYYCSRSKNVPYSLEKIHQRMAVLAEEIPKVALQPAKGEEDIINRFDLGHPVTELYIEYSALMFLAVNPPDPRGEKMFCRVAPYFIHVSTKELALAIGKHYKTVERAKKLVHEKLGLLERADVTVDEFCKILGYSQDDTDKIHQNLECIRQGKWKKIKDIHNTKDVE